MHVVSIMHWISLCRNEATEHTVKGKKKSVEHRNSHVLQDLNKIDDSPILSLPNADGTFHGKRAFFNFFDFHSNEFVHLNNFSVSNEIEATSVRMFTCKKLRYIWNTETKEFLKVKSLGPGMPTSSLHHPDAQQGLAGLSILEQQRRFNLIRSMREFLSSF
jgi:cation-transporting ATPase 13A3/4/5